MNSPPSEKSRAVALALCIPLGVFGAHRFYAGKIGTGILQLCTMGGFGLWWLFDLITIASGEFRDVDGRRISLWDPADSPARLPGVPQELLGQGGGIPRGGAGPARGGGRACMAVGQQLCDGMRARATAKMRATLHPDARLFSAGVKDSVPTVTIESISAWLRGTTISAPRTRLPGGGPR